MADIHACLAVRGHQEHMTSSRRNHEKQRRSSAGLDRKETNLRVPRNDAVTVSSEQLILRRQQNMEARRCCIVSGRPAGIRLFLASFRASAQDASCGGRRPGSRR